MRSRCHAVLGDDGRTTGTVEGAHQHIGSEELYYIVSGSGVAYISEGDDPATDYFGYTYDILSRANALANQLWLVCSNQVDRPSTPGCANYYGHSRIVAPNGQIVAEIGHEEGLVTATVDLREGLERGRTLDFFGLNLLQDRRPEFYGLVADKAIYHHSEVSPLVRQSFPPRIHEREEVDVPERELVASD